MPPRTTNTSLRAGLVPDIITEHLDDSPSSSMARISEDIPDPLCSSSPDQTPNLAEAIALLAKNLQTPKKSSHSKVHEPDMFDGSDTRNLQPFLVQCALNF